MTFKTNKIANMTSKKMYMLRKVKTGFIMCVSYCALFLFGCQGVYEHFFHQLDFFCAVD